MSSSTEVAVIEGDVGDSNASSSAETIEKCCFRSCKVKGAVLVECAASNCNKKVHYMCYQGLLLGKHNELQPLPAGKATCTKRCHLKATKENAGGADEADGGNRRGGWDSDGLKGSDDPKTSVRVLLDWWMAEGNYVKFCGKNNGGVKKKQICNALAEKMSNETNSKRDAKNVLSKIQHIERSFREAHIFATSETGAGVKADDEGNFKEIVEKKCPYYYDLVDIMSDRASAKPKATSYDLDEENEEDVSDISDEEGTRKTDKSYGSKTTDKSNGSKKKKRKGSPLIDDEALAALQSASQTSQLKMNELVRHHKFLEVLEEKKLSLEEKKEKREAASWKGKTDELDYKMQLIQRYKQLKDDFDWDDDQILSFYPDMEQVIKAQKKQKDN
jgi:hypothetical protein